MMKKPKLLTSCSKKKDDAFLHLWLYTTTKYPTILSGVLFSFMKSSGIIFYLATKKEKALIKSTWGRIGNIPE